MRAETATVITLRNFMLLVCSSWRFLFRRFTVTKFSAMRRSTSDARMAAPRGSGSSCAAASAGAADSTTPATPQSRYITISDKTTTSGHLNLKIQELSREGRNGEKITCDEAEVDVSLSVGMQFSLPKNCRKQVFKLSWTLES